MVPVIVRAKNLESVGLKLLLAINYANEVLIYNWPSEAVLRKSFSKLWIECVVQSSGKLRVYCNLTLRQIILFQIIIASNAVLIDRLVVEVAFLLRAAGQLLNILEEKLVDNVLGILLLIGRFDPGLREKLHSLAID